MMSPARALQALVFNEWQRDIEVMGSDQSQLNGQQVFSDKALLATIFLSIVIGYGFWSLMPCDLNFTQFRAPTVWINTLLIYPLFEELAFRGTIQEALLKLNHPNEVYYGISKANLITSVIFSGFHSIYQPIYLAALIIFPSFVLGFFKERYSTILVPIGLHIVFNIVFIFTKLTNTCL